MKKLQEAGYWDLLKIEPSDLASLYITAFVAYAQSVVWSQFEEKIEFVASVKHWFYYFLSFLPYCEFGAKRRDLSKIGNPDQFFVIWKKLNDEELPQKNVHLESYFCFNDFNVPHDEKTDHDEFESLQQLDFVGGAGALTSSMSVESDDELEVKIENAELPLWAKKNNLQKRRKK